MNALYPLKFNPIIKEKIWGGRRLNKVLNKNIGTIDKAGESWEISGVEGAVSIVANGFLQNNNIEELIEVYMGDLVGDAVYDKFRTQFPLLIKFIDANDYLSIQVHPDDEMAQKFHGENGKTEMWYIVEAEKNAELIVGFNQNMDKAKFVQAFGAGMLRDTLNYEKVLPKDVFYLPAGRIHATGPGILFAEIQQTSDLTYRIYDWDRVDDKGNARELHIEKAVEVIDYEKKHSYKTSYSVQENQSSSIVDSQYFVTNKIDLTAKIEKDYNWLDSFVIFMAVGGDFTIWYNDNNDSLVVKNGDSILLPAVLKNISLEPQSQKAEILEVYIFNSN